MKLPRNHSALICTLSGLLLFFSSCYENVDGCLDVLSTNYAVTADVRVDSLCSYPTLELDFDATFGDTSFLRSKLYSVNGSDSFAIINHSILLSAVELTNDLGDKAILDSFDLYFVDVDTTKVVRTSATQEDIRLGFGGLSFDNFKMPGDYGTLSFQLGLTEQEQTVDTDLLDSDSKLGNLISSYYVSIDTGFVQQRISFVLDSLTSDTLSLVWYGDELSVPFEFDLEQEAVIRQNFVVSFYFDYKKWFDGVNLSTDELSVAKDILTQNMVNTISIVE